MIRLIASGEPDFLMALERRLEGVKFVDPVDDWDAILNIDLPPIDEVWVDVAEHWLATSKHVLTAGDPHLTDNQLERLATAATKSGAAFSVVNPDHFLPSRQLIRQQLDAGKFGTPGLIRIHRWESVDLRSRPSQGTLPPPLYRDIEMAVSLMGQLPNLVYATEAVKGAIPDACQRTVQVHLGFSTGGMAVIDYSNALPAGDSYQSLSLIGSSGAVYADDHQNVQLLYQGDQPRAVKVDEELRRWTNLTQEFLDGIAANRDFSKEVAAWKQVRRVTDAVLLSLTSRRAVTGEGL